MHRCSSDTGCIYQVDFQNKIHNYDKQTCFNNASKDEFLIDFIGVDIHDEEISSLLIHRWFTQAMQCSSSDLHEETCTKAYTTSVNQK